MASDVGIGMYAKEAKEFYEKLKIEIEKAEDELANGAIGFDKILLKFAAGSFGGMITVSADDVRHFKEEDNLYKPVSEKNFIAFASHATPLELEEALKNIKSEVQSSKAKSDLLKDSNVLDTDIKTVESAPELNEDKNVESRDELANDEKDKEQSIDEKTLDEIMNEKQIETQMEAQNVAPPEINTDGRNL